MSMNIRERDSVLLTAMMLCYLEIATGSSYEWTTHLQGANSLVDFYHGSDYHSTESPFSIETIRFVSDFLSLRETFSATAQENHPVSLGTWTSYVHVLYPFLWEDNNAAKTHINAHNGLSAELLDIISSITELARCKYQSMHEGLSGCRNDICLLEEVDAIRKRLTQLQQWSEEQDPHHRIYINASAFEEAAWTYLEYVVNENSIRCNAIQKIHLPKLLGMLRRVHTKQGELLGSLPYPMWALFIAACVVQEPDRVTILDMFTELKSRRPISNVPRTEAAVLAIWKRNDLFNEPMLSNAAQIRSTCSWGNTLDGLGWKLALT